jgi:hypothetical protein
MFVIPVLIDRATLPSAETLPDDLRPLVFHQAHQVRHEHFRQDVDGLIKALAKEKRSIRPRGRAGRVVLWSLLALVMTISVMWIVSLYWRNSEPSRSNPFQEEMARRTTAFDLQERCAKQSRAEFEALGWAKKENSAVFTNHYNAKLNKCFTVIEVDNLMGASVKIKMLFDAFEGKSYGHYTWQSQPGKKYWEVPPRDCGVKLASGEEQTCHSSDEFDELADYYMETKAR